MNTRRRIDYRTLIGYLLILAGSLMGVWLGISLMMGLQTLRWPESTTIIYQSEVVNTTANPRDKLQTLHTAQISYRYRVDGTTYSNDRIYHTDIPLLGHDVAADLVLEFPTGSLQKVYYDPADHKSAVLKTGISNILLMLIAPTVLFLVVGFRAVRTD